MAANEPTSRESSVTEDGAKSSLVNALYEIRRGYNLDSSHTPKDDGASARNICAGGTFNKISEKTVSVIKGTSSLMITTETLRISIEATIKREIENIPHLEQQSLRDGIRNNEGQLTQQAWDAIKDKVIASIKKEFKNYPIISGQSLEQRIADLTDFENVLQYLNVT